MVVLLFAPGAFAQNYDAGREAYLQGDYARAYEILRPLAEGGNSDAQKLLGIMYDYGHGVDADPATALQWYLKSAEQGDPAVQYQVGAKYFRGDGTKQDYARAARWWEQAANGGQVDAQFNLGLMYFRGLSVPANDARAAQLFAAAAGQGHSHAQYSLAVMYANGRGVPRDYGQALEWFNKAADQGVAQAQYNLGVFYEHGHGIPSDLAVARSWYERAAAQGLEEAAAKLAELDGAVSPGSAVVHPDEIAATKSAKPAPRPVSSTRVYDPREDGPADRMTAAAAPVPTPTPAPASAAAGDGIRREDWVLAQDPKSYTLQIGSVTEEKDIRRFLRQTGLETEAAYIEVVIDGTTRYNALYGAFTDYGAAEAAVAALPPEVQRVKPWIRNFGVLQKLIR